MMTEFLPIAVEAISTVGFPIVISFYLLHRLENKMDHMIQALNNLVQVLAQK